MGTRQTTYRRNLFEIENARNLTREEMVATFVPTKAFWRLLSAKNHVVLGSRGSGKTALAKMLSHDHLSLLDDVRARKAVESKSFIGIYVPTRLEWVGGLKNKPWQSESERDLFFQWRLNLSSCVAFLITLRSCLNQYIADRGDRARLESNLVPQISAAWSGEQSTCETIRELHNYLEDLEHEKQQQLARRRVLGPLFQEAQVGIAFDTDLFTPLRRAITLTTRLLDIPTDAAWLLCLDEAEFLDVEHHQILNSHLRTHSGDLFFKITTMPYCHHTLATNTRVPLDVGHDFEYVYIDQDPILLLTQGSDEEKQFAGTLFNKRAQISYSRRRQVTLTRLLGESALLDSKDGEDWSRRSKNMAMLRKHASPETWQRAVRLHDDPSALMDQVIRKIRGALLLREAVSGVRGRTELDVFSGAAMIVRCGDANPRRLIRIFNTLLLKTRWKSHMERRQSDTRVVSWPVRLSKKTQTRILTEFSTIVLRRVQSEPNVGPQLYEFVQAIGLYMQECLLREPLRTDQVSSVSIDENTPADCWVLIRRAVGLGLLYPNVGSKNPDEMPERDGVFRLAYVLAPHFKILPRRGKSRKLSLILSFWKQYKQRQRANAAHDQGLLFPMI